MKHGAQGTVLLIFSLSKEKEVKRKTIFEQEQYGNNVALFKLLIEQVENLANQSGIDVFWVDERQQVGPDFASRFTNAFQNLFDIGYERVLSIGNDCPGLTIELLSEAIQKLSNQSMVLGPATDGGVYLLGMDRSAFDGNTFHQLPWQTKELHHGLKRYGRVQNIEVALLRELRDIDSFEDLFNYVKSNPLTEISRWFNAVVKSLNTLFYGFDDIIVLSFFNFSRIGLRAPPFTD